MSIEPTLVENTTDATRGEPLGLRAQKRRAELEIALAALPAAWIALLPFAAGGRLVRRFSV